MENLTSFAHPFSSITQPSNLDYFSNFLYGVPSFDFDDLEIDWTAFDPKPFGIPSPDPNPLPVTPVEMLPFDPTDNMAFETPSPQPSPSDRNQVSNIENDFNPTSFFTPCPDLTENMVFTMPRSIVMPSSSTPPRNQMMNIENGFNPTSFFTPCPDPTENMVFEMPRSIAMPSSSTPPRNQTMNIDNGFNPTSSFVIPYPEPNPIPGRQVEMPPRFDPTENMVIENPWNNAMQPSSSSLPCNQTMNLENNLNPTPNQELVTPVEMHQFNPIGNMVFENQRIATSSSSSPANTVNLDFRAPFGDECKTNTDIIYDNYLRAYGVDSSSARTAIDRNGAAVFNDTNALFFSSVSEMQYFPAAPASSPSTEFPPPCHEVEAATHGGADSSAFKSKWSVEEHMLFLIGMEIYGRGDWTNIADNVVITKTNTQVSSHAQKHFLRLTVPRKTKGKKRASIHDITIVDPELLSTVRARLGRPPSSLPVNK